MSSKQIDNLIIRKSSALKKCHPETTALVLLLMAIIAVILLNPIYFSVSIASYNKLSIFSLLTPLIAVGTVSCAIAKRSSLKPNFLDMAVLAFLLYFLVRNIYGPENTAAFKFVIYGACLYFLASIVVHNRKAFNFLVLAIVLIASVAIIYGFIEYSKQYNFLFPNHANLHPAKSLHRIGSTLSQPVLFGAFLIQVFPFIVLMICSRVFWLRSIAITAFIWAFAALLMTYSKGSWITAILIAATLFFYLARSGIRNLLPVLVIITMCFAIVIVFWNQAANDVSVRINGSVKTREVSWDGAVQGISENIFGGVGFRQGGNVMNGYLTPEWIGTASIDNTYLSLLLEEGIVGFLLWMIVLGTTIVYGIRASSSNSNHRFWALAALFSLVGFAINSFTFDTHLVWANFTFFWICTGIIRGVYQLDNNLDKIDNPYMLRS